MKTILFFLLGMLIFSILAYFLGLRIYHLTFFDMIICFLIFCYLIYKITYLGSSYQLLLYSWIYSDFLKLNFKILLNCLNLVVLYFNYLENSKEESDWTLHIFMGQLSLLNF